MADAYLNVAEQVMRRCRRPLRPKEIVRLAYAEGLLPWHLHGSRQDKTLHARLSEDVSRRRETSPFFRTGPGEFFLQSLRDDNELPESFKQVYLAPPRKKELKRDWVLTIVKAGLERRIDGTISVESVRAELESGRYYYQSHSDAEKSADVAIVQSFVVIFQDEMILSFRRGRYSALADPLLSERSIGIGGIVFAHDSDLLFDSMYGIVENGVQALSYGIGLPRDHAERARYGNQVLPVLAIDSSNEAQVNASTLYVVLGYRCPRDFRPTRGALSVNDLRWINTRVPSNSLDDYDETSRAVLEGDYVKEIFTADRGRGS